MIFFVSSQENIPVNQLLNLNTTAMDLLNLTILYNKTALLPLGVVFITEIIRSYDTLIETR